MKSKRAREAVEGEAPARDELAEAPTKKRKRDGEHGSEEKVKEKKSKKDKKHKQESRKERKEKRKDLMDLPEEDPEVEEVDAPPAQSDSKSKTKADEQPEATAEAKAKKEKKKKEKKEKKEKAKSESNGKTADETPGAADDENPNKIQVEGADDNKKADRHIVFVGNLPFTATAATITAHFASLSPISVRCLKNKDDDKPCRGIAFVEFGKVWHMRTCLDKFHHSMFDDGVSPARKINVELTAGGGGKNKNRHDKIREKNQKLEENRGKRIEKEKVAKQENKKPSDDQHMQDAIHPSRRARVPGRGY